jgi:hypothetical protein
MAVMTVPEPPQGVQLIRSTDRELYHLVSSGPGQLELQSIIDVLKCPLDHHTISPENLGLPALLAVDLAPVIQEGRGVTPMSPWIIPDETFLLEYLKQAMPWYLHLQGHQRHASLNRMASEPLGKRIRVS